MRLELETAEIFVPDDLPIDDALARTSHMAIGAHQDDLEIMAADGILQCFGRQDQWFCGVVATNGSGSPRSGQYADYSDGQMRTVRRLEQRKAAVVGEYGAQVLLDHSSAAVKDPQDTTVINDISALIEATRPEVLYVHNLADKHDTHIGLALKVVASLRGLPQQMRPQRLYGCEVWRGLDWMVDEDKVAFDLSSHENLLMALVGVFDSQIAGGKRYDLATLGRWRANATYSASHDTDRARQVGYAMDLTPLISDPSLPISDYVEDVVNRLKRDVADRIARFLPR
jgi:LmbE family N-acetylglucosaminyl deacetylase